jgi:hypothetical protein
MAKLTPEQLQTVTTWAEDGATLNDIQRRLKDEFGLVITYLEARLLMMDVGVRLKDKPREPEPVAAAPDQLSPADSDGDLYEDELGAEDGLDYTEDTTPPTGSGRVTVTVDALTLSGAVVSGKAEFSDGKTISWYVDQMGRLGMRAPEAGYQPPQEDVIEFQNQLDQVLMKQGF